MKIIILMLTKILIIFFLGIALYPGIIPVTTCQGESVEYKNNLYHIKMLQLVHKQEFGIYGSNLQQIGFASTSDQMHYTYQVIFANRSDFRARASEHEDYNQDGILNVYEINAEGELFELIIR
ncbi:MAG: hypothetical protein R3B93_19110 [Bacteroidia bacterium]